MKNETATAQKTVSINKALAAAVPPDNLRRLLVVHAILTFAAGIVLIAAPDLIPGAVGIHIEPSANLICYLLAAAELCITVLSWGGRRLSDAKALRVIVWAFLIFHASSGVLEIYAFAGGLSAAIWGNVAVRAVVIFLFAYYGLYRLPDDAAQV